jgi:hypothetical protein
MTFESSPAQLSPATSLYSIWFRCWADAIGGIVRMPAVALVTFAVLIPLEAVNSTLVLSGEGKSVVIRLASAIAQAFLLAPLLIAVHRYVLLSEVTRHYSLRPFGRYLRFAGYALIFEVITEIATQFIAKAGSYWAFAIQIIGLIVLLYVALRILILFPAIAIDAPGASWRQAMRESRGQSLALLLTVLLASLPLVLIVFVFGTVVAIIASPNPEPSGPGVLPTVAWAAAAVLFGAAYAAMASRLYRAFGGTP